MFLCTVRRLCDGRGGCWGSRILHSEGDDGLSYRYRLRGINIQACSLSVSTERAFDGDRTTTRGDFQYSATRPSDVSNFFLTTVSRS
jgi:hypothetical protein